MRGQESGPVCHSRKKKVGVRQGDDKRCGIITLTCVVRASLFGIRRQEMWPSWKFETGEVSVWVFILGGRLYVLTFVQIGAGLV